MERIKEKGFGKPETDCQGTESTKKDWAKPKLTELDTRLTRSYKSGGGVDMSDSTWYSSS